MTLNYTLDVDFNVLPPSQHGGGSVDAIIYSQMIGPPQTIKRINFWDNSNSSQISERVTLTRTVSFNAGDTNEIVAHGYAYGDVYIGNYANTSVEVTIEEIKITFDMEDTWEFHEEGITAGCIGTAPGSSGNGPYESEFSLWVEQNGNTITGSGNCSDGNPIYLGGTVSGTTVQFRRYGPGCTPGYTVDWDYSGVIQGQNITGTFSGGGDPEDPYAEGCMTSGTFTISQQCVTTPVVKSWTLMFYLDGDNDLNDTYPPIVNQLEAEADNSNVQVVALWDRIESNNSAYYQIQHDDDLNKLANYAANVNYWSQGELNTGTSQTLVNFVNWARINYPAQHYALILSDHGSGVTGGMIDYSTSSGPCMGNDNKAHDCLTVKETGTALASITNNGTNKIDVLYMDACLMGMIEDAYQVRNYVDYYVGSENLQWSYADPYSPYVSGVTVSTTPAQLASLFSTSYANAASGGNKAYTISAADISQLSSLVTATNNLAQLLNSHMNTFSNTLTSIRSAVQRFDNAEPINVINSSDQYIDLYHFAQLVKANITDNDIKTAALAVMTAVDDNFIINEHHQTKSGTTVGNSHGVSIFFPATPSSFYNGNNLDFAGDTNWLGSTSSSVTAQAVIDWGPMLVSYFKVAQPGGADNPTPPKPIARQNESQAVYLPIIIK
jgi:hypothetical protein